MNLIKNIFLPNVMYIVIGILMYIAFRIIDGYVIPVMKEKKYINKYWQRLQIVVWLLYFYILVSMLFEMDIIKTITFLGVVIGLGWTYWRNIFSGILIRFNQELKEGDIISTDFASGEIVNINLAQSELKNAEGELIIIPNYRLKSAVLKQLHEKKTIKTHSFTIKTDEDLKSEDVYQRALNCPYLSSNQDVLVEKKGVGEFILKAIVVDECFLDEVGGW